jgi:GH15 family glucan-1,4-alpha-glucosidase
VRAIGTARDYRYCWLRDAAFVVDLRYGHL